jgi:hypothetical protein
VSVIVMILLLLAAEANYHQLDVNPLRGCLDGLATSSSSSARPRTHFKVVPFFGFPFFDDPFPAAAASSSLISSFAIISFALGITADLACLRRPLPLTESVYLPL